MYTTFVSLAVVAAAAVGVVAQDINLATPVFTQCQPAHISWPASTGPYNLIVVPAANPCDSVLADLGDHHSTSMTWNVSLAAGTQVLVSIEDANTNEGWTKAITVGDSSDKSCLSPAQLAVASSAGADSATTVVVSTTPTPAAIQNAGAGTTQPAATAVGAAGAGIIGGTSGAAGLAVSGPLALGGALLAALAMF